MRIFFLPCSAHGWLVEDSERLWAVPNLRAAWDYRLPVTGPEPRATDELPDALARVAAWTLGLPDAPRPSRSDLLETGAMAVWLKSLAPQMGREAP